MSRPPSTMNTCPLSTLNPQPIIIPPVPAEVQAEVLVVPRPSHDITGSEFNMGGTTPSRESSRNAPSYSWDSYQQYQVSPPHGQNTLTPCKVIGKAPFSPLEEQGIPNEPLIADPNRGPRRSYVIYSPGQEMVGRVSTTMGTEGPLYSRLPSESNQSGVNGNADFVRGNDFGWNYNSQMITDRPKYVYTVPAQQQKNPVFYAKDPFYPAPGFCRDKNAWMPDPSAGKPNYPDSNLQGRTYKTYPTFTTWTDNGIPTWTYPYSTSMPVSESPTILVNPNENIIQENFEMQNVMEHFVNERETCSQKDRVIYWFGVFALLMSLWGWSRK